VCKFKCWLIYSHFTFRLTFSFKLGDSLSYRQKDISSGKTFAHGEHLCYCIRNYKDIVQTTLYDITHDGTNTQPLWLLDDDFNKGAQQKWARAIMLPKLVPYTLYSFQVCNLLQLFKFEWNLPSCCRGIQTERHNSIKQCCCQNSFFYQHWHIKSILLWNLE